jgi:putative redox protein
VHVHHDLVLRGAQGPHAALGVRALHLRPVHAKDCEDCESADGGWLEHITSEIFIEGQFTDEQRARLREIALRCPVHKTLEKGVRFEESVTVG